MSQFVTEMDIKQAQHYKIVFEIFKKYKDNISRITFWNLSDSYSWLGTGIK
jgi:endo-1,4-beta-xylanase